MAIVNASFNFAFPEACFHCKKSIQHPANMPTQNTKIHRFSQCVAVYHGVFTIQYMLFIIAGQKDYRHILEDIGY